MASWQLSPTRRPASTSSTIPAWLNNVVWSDGLIPVPITQHEFRWHRITGSLCPSSTRLTFVPLWEWISNVLSSTWTIHCGVEFSGKMESKAFDWENRIRVCHFADFSNICSASTSTATSLQSAARTTKKMYFRFCVPTLHGAARKAFCSHQSKLAGKGPEHSGNL